MREIRTTCRGCGHGGCGVIVRVSEKGEIDSIVGDPAHPVSKGYICIKAFASVEAHNSHDRLQFPLKRSGNEWARISWDEALETIGSKLNKISKESGPEYVAFVRGTGRHYNHFMERFSNVFGSPNRVSNAHMCYIPRNAVATRILGLKSLPVVDYDSIPACVVVWGANPIISNPDEYKGINLENALKHGTKLIVIDPRKTALAERADVFLQPQPATDMLVAMSMLNIIITEKLYDIDFVKNFSANLDALSEFVREFTPEKVESRTGVPSEKMREAARMYAKMSPAAIHWGVGLEQNLNCVGTDTALLYLVALTGNLDRKGGNVNFENPPVISYGEFVARDKFPTEKESRRLGGDRFKLLSMVDRVTPYYLWRSIVEGEPYRVRALFCVGSNLLASREESKLVNDALESVEFLVVSDQFMTPTAEQADIVLPSATWMESNCMADYWKVHGVVSPHAKVVDPPGEAWSDMKIFNELAKRVGLGEYFWKDVDESLEYVLAPSGLTWDQFVKKGFLQGPKNYEKYRATGFKTDSGRFDFWPRQFREWGLGPLPQYSDYSTALDSPDLFKEFPLTLVSGCRSMEYFNSEGRQLSMLRRRHPYPIAEIHPETARVRAIADGDWLEIRTPKASIIQKAKLSTRVTPSVVSAEHGWWYPELGNDWKLSNTNIITRSDPSGTR